MALKIVPAHWHLGSLRQWHWISSAVCLVGMLLFAATGITLNHAAIIPATPVVTSIESVLPPSVLDAVIVPDSDKASLSKDLRAWLERELDIYIPASARCEGSDEEVYVALPSPGGDAWPHGRVRPRSHIDPGRRPDLDPRDIHPQEVMRKEK